MKPVKSTAEILAFKALNRDVDKTWVDWDVTANILRARNPNELFQA
jgi:hypothetical protein